ncbi:hypothetical protein Q2T40_06135 [Winogradskyella maritima]|uniref:Uncharacterized protein n=1 Tax=Winogradskyella maritima TaxID=1517766 RepID=A0ABV8AIW0_9FLAO|nr:hypothetical protein [Winogradskyella maritima]
MKKTLLILLLLLGVSRCQRDFNTKTDAIQLIPYKMDYIIKVDNLKDLSSLSENHPVLSKLTDNQISNYKALLQKLNTTDMSYLGFKVHGDESLFSISTKFHDSLIAQDSTAYHLPISPSMSIGELGLKNDTLYYRQIDSLFFGSNSQSLVSTADTIKTNSNTASLIHTMSDNASAGWMASANSPLYHKLSLGTSTDSISLSNTSAFDVDFDSDAIRYNGITKLDSLSLIYILNSTTAQELKSQKIAPRSVDQLTSISFNDFEQLRHNLESYTKTKLDSTIPFLNYSDEIALFKSEKNTSVVVHAIDAQLMKDYMEQQSLVETFRDFSIFQIEDESVFRRNLSPLLQLEDVNYVVQIEDFFVFSDKVSTLQTIISSNLNNQTLSEAEAFKSINESLSDASSLFVYKNGESLSESLGDDFKVFNANAVQYIVEDDFAHMNGVIKSFNASRRSAGISEAFNYKLPDAILNPPQVVKNHITKGKDILVQDVKNKIHLISASGRRLWTKQLTGEILGQVEQIDIYKNGRLQLAFATANRLYVLDRNGNDVGPFPIKFRDKVTQPLSVFDYDSKRDYRLLITQGSKLLMYSTKAKRIKGFDFKGSNSEILTQPKHIRNARKDYIVFAQGNRLKILNRRGQNRINVSNTIDFSGNPIFLHKNKFTTTNKNGQLVQVDMQGRVLTVAMGLKTNHSIDATSKTLVSFSENELKIRAKTLDLDYGDYTAPKLFYLNDKIYVTLTDKQAKKVHLFDSKAEYMPNFPVYGSASATIANLNNSGGLELVTQSDDQTILVYHIN